jgi:hypothetical protein
MPVPVRAPGSGTVAHVNPAEHRYLAGIAAGTGTKSDPRDVAFDDLAAPRIVDQPPGPSVMM